ncbi:hypothetical protein [Micromonospora sp. NBC_01796]|uniref:hypothetical protein n=1 Tax=Micromonospora sp. NBC_01796 TaxID=2975987 RepID=UPI002DDC1079|nr:hypothetical protein [Micromonospora sp. NBC_01796]WSA83774.1 hypothetical protein OIE47_25775 [Micromonospora sp. NBC_01796]
MDNQTESTRHGFEDLLGEVLRDAGPAADALRAHLPRVAGAVYAAMLTERIERLAAAGNLDDPADRADPWRRIHELGARLWQFTEPAAVESAPAKPAAVESDAFESGDAVTDVFESGDAVTDAVEPGDAVVDAFEPDVFDQDAAGSGAAGPAAAGRPGAAGPGGMDRRGTPDPTGGTASVGTPVRTERVTAGTEAYDRTGGTRQEVGLALIAGQVEEVLARFVADDRVRVWLGNTPAPGGTLAARWRSFHLGLLRLPASVAREWADDAARVVPRIWYVADERWTMLQHVYLHRVIIPGWGGEPGVCLDPQGGVSPGVLAASGSAFEEHFRVTSYATQVEWLVANDLTALHVRDAKLEPLRDKEEQRRYRKRLHDALQSYAGQPNTSTGNGDPAQRLIRAAGLAEVLRSVVHQPLVAPDSWWGSFRREVSGLVDDTVQQLDRQFGREPERQFDQRFEATHLKGWYRDLIQQQHTERTLDVRLPAPPTARTGEVLDCLRPRLVLGETGTRPGVVMYADEA